MSREHLKRVYALRSLRSGRKTVLLCLAWHADPSTGGYCSGIEPIGQATGQARRTILGHLNALGGVGLITHTRRCETKGPAKGWRGRRRLDIRVYTGPASAREASANGFVIRPEQIDDLIPALEAGHREAVRQGWIKDCEPR
jgi:hypothetical protein